MARKAGIRSYETRLIPCVIEDEEPHRSTGAGHLFGVVKNDSEGMAMPGTYPAHAMSKIHSVEATRSLDGAMMHRESNGVPLA